MGDDGFLHGLAQVLPQVPAVRALRRLWRATGGCLGVGAGPVAGNDPDFGVGTQPRGEGVGVATGQHVDRPVPILVEQDGAVDLPAFDREVVD
jgi:hypothetical protein